jgi:hypothetical protein
MNKQQVLRSSCCQLPASQNEAQKPSNGIFDTGIILVIQFASLCFLLDEFQPRLVKNT